MRSKKSYLIQPSVLNLNHLKQPFPSKIILVLIILTFSLALISCDRKSKEELLNEGMKYSQQGNYRGAVVLYKNALEKDPNYFEARFQLADAYQMIGKYEQAEKEFLKVQRQAPSNPELPLKLAEIYLYTARNELAITEMGKYLLAYPESSPAYDTLGRAHAVNKDFSTARQAFRTAIRLDAKNPLPKLHLAQILIIVNESDLARQLLEELLAGDEKNIEAYYLMAGMEKSMGNLDRALVLYRELVQHYPAAFKASYLAGILLLDKGDFEAVAVLATDLISRFPKRPEGPRLKGMMLYFQKDFAEAEAELLQSMQFGTDLSTLYFLGLSYYQLGKLETALNQFQKVLDLKETFIQARVMVAMTLLKQKRLDDAINEAQKALKVQDDNALAHNILGSAYLAKGLYDEAMAEFDRAIEINPALVDAHLKKGLFSMAKGDSVKAEAELEMALTVAPEILNTRILLGSFYMRQQNYDAAVKTMQEGLTKKPTDALLYNYMAAAFFAQKKADEAIVALEKAKQVKPDYFTPYFNIAAYYSSKADYDKAIEQYQAVLALDQNNLKALLTAAALSELKGDETTALEFFTRASQTQDPRGYLALALYYHRAKQDEEVHKTLDEGLKIHPDHPAILEIKGRLLAEQGRTSHAAPFFQALEKVKPGRGIPLLITEFLKNDQVDNAVAEAKKIITRKPQSSYGYVLLSSIYEQQKNYEEAEKVILEGSAQTGDKNPGLRMRLGMLYEKTHKTELAMQTYQDLAKQYPKFYNATFAMGALNDRIGNKREALKLYEEVLAKNEKHLPSLNNAAYLYAENYSNKEKALELAMKAYRLRSSDSGVMDTLGYVLLQNGRGQEALQLLVKAARLLPKNPTVLYHLALACNNQNKNPQAISILEKALILNDFPEKQKTQKLLKKLTASKP